MNILRIFVAFLCASLLGACESKNVQLKEEVIAIHDEVMPHMGKLQSLQKDLSEKADQMSAKDSTGQSEQIRLLRNTAMELGAAYDGMFVWMRQFQPDQGEMTEEEFQQYLKEQKALVEKVKLDINRALEKAENIQ